MTSFNERFPDCATSEQLVLHSQFPGRPLPPGEYGFFEFYCEDPKCDCRRVLLQIRSPQRPGEILATINYGWESEAFYTAWMRGDAEAGREITSADLDPLNPQSNLADALLDGFHDYIRHNSFYPQRLRLHYEMFKSTQATEEDWDAPEFGDEDNSMDDRLDKSVDTPPFEPLQPYVAPAKAGRNDPCPCGSSRKYKKCCGK